MKNKKAMYIEVSVLFNKHIWNKRFYNLDNAIKFARKMAKKEATLIYMNEMLYTVHENGDYETIF